MLYKAALREAVAVVTEEGAEAPTTFNPNAPHPYALALGVLSVQKVRTKKELLSLLGIFMVTSKQCLTSW